MNAIKKARMIAGYNQSELAKKLGVSCATISLWESGRSLPRAKRLQSVAQALNTTAEKLLEEREM